MGTSNIMLGGTVFLNKDDDDDDGLVTHSGGEGGSNTPSHFIVYKPGHPVMD